MFFAFSCDSTKSSELLDLSASEMSEDRVSSDPYASSVGSLPFGYYLEQCQWDACNPPPQDKRSIDTDPVP